jgi:arylsulfatase A-like enzyme
VSCSRAAAVVLLGLVALPGCSGGPPGGARPRALLLIVIDTLRADRLGHAGYAAASTPTLDSLAASGLRFSNATTPAPTTLPAVTSLVTGLYPTAHGVRDNGWFALDPSFETLAERFRGAGFRTGAVVGSAVLEKERGLAAGFETWDDAFSGEYPVYRESLREFAADFAKDRRRADTVTDLARDALQRFGRERFFLLVHYFDVHMHYDPPPRLAAMHEGRPYDGEISFVDEQIGRLLALVPQDVLVVVVSDHGESQGEHGEPQHGFLLYEATLRVPVLVSGPGVPQGAERSEPMSLVDLEPTLARVFDLPSDGRERDGRALAWVGPAPEPVPLYAETFHPLVSYGWSELRSVRLGRWKLIEGGGSSELYDLVEDPGETVDRGGENAPAELRELLHGIARGEDAEEIRASARATQHAQSREKLASLGYVVADGSPPRGRRPHPRDELPRFVGRQEAKRLLGEAAVLANRRRFAAAIAAADSAVTLDPASAEARHAKGRLLLATGEKALAETELRAAVELDPDDAGVLRSLAGLLVQGDSPSDALPWLRRLVALDSTDAPARFDLGYAAWEAGELEEASAHWRAFLRLRPDDPQAEDVRTWLRDIEGGG